MYFTLTTSDRALLLMVAALITTTTTTCKGFAFPSLPAIPAAKKSPPFTKTATRGIFGSIISSNINRSDNDNDINRNRNRNNRNHVYRKSVALASFDFFQPGDAFYDDDGDDIDDLYNTDSSNEIDPSFDDEHNEYSKIGVHHKVHWLEPEMRGMKSLGEAIADGEAVVSIPDMADFGECLDLVSEGLRARRSAGTETARGRSRFSVSDPSAFPDPAVVASCEEILLRVLDHADEHLPSVYETLFRPGEDWLWRQPLTPQLEQPTVAPEAYLAETCDSLRELYLMSELEWSEGEPAINVYEPDGYFGCHKDHLALTVLLPLTDDNECFSGGGTAFWRGNRETSEDPRSPPDLVLKPPKGTALVFGGDVTHSGMLVEAGYRSVFVCSFSTRTPASAPNRLHGMRSPPEVSPSFKGTV